MQRSPSHSESVESAQITDRELILLFADQGDQVAFRTLVDRHGALVFRVCRGILRHHQDAEDAFQATFLVLARKAGKVRWRPSLANWLYGTARRIALKSSIQRQNDQRKAMQDEPEAIDVFEALAARDAERTLHEELDHLPEQLRAPLILCYLEGKTQNQAAADLGVPPSTINGRLQRGRLRLRLQLARRGIGLAISAAAAGQTLSIQPAGAASLTSTSLTAPPEPLVSSTVQAATEFASGLAPSGAASSEALTLAKGELAMFTSTTVMKLSTATGALVAVLGVSWLLLSSDASAEGPLLPLETQLAAEPAGAQPPAATIAAEHEATFQFPDAETYGIDASRSLILVGSRRGNVISAFSAHTGQWHVQPYKSAAGESLKSDVRGDLVVFEVSNRVYGFSGLTGSWDSFEVPEGIHVEPVLRGDFATVQVGDTWYAFSSLAPDPKWVAMSFDGPAGDAEGPSR